MFRFKSKGETVNQYVHNTLSKHLSSKNIKIHTRRVYKMILKSRSYIADTGWYGLQCTVEYQVVYVWVIHSLLFPPDPCSALQL